ncbi:MAG: 4-(cytidine 5'-diphospho)-2-C-methyl-D-erythritol kinase [Candidatus Improbicoccus pseudotrichonymphae]|uniref:4-(cytidine 5'-diphospho)-2-C-methyl-D-erythritol kinase n=1 Tax=Candidatus Improbicoccus pseudotrichonymphae TaxID=3033792 RepID=A0AA48L0Y8_9FIRM|nr:MAG: 4-(cytidine 5'-diphospho)-2-C-methyl-D-erythritol kinase [Candidatus Improbicoccus pseudotrichonymphae]
MIVQTVDLCDYISIRPSGKFGINVVCDKKIESLFENCAYIAAKTFFDFIKKNKNIEKNIGVNIEIEKNIPINSGLGGGSADAAAVIFALNKIFNCNLELCQLVDLAFKIGSDVPLFLTGGTMRIRGCGNKIEKIKPIKNCNILIVKPNFDISTKKAYEIYDDKILDSEKRNNEEDSRMSSLLNSIEIGENDEIFKSTFNDFEKVMSQEDTSYRLTGSGSAMFRMFSNEFQAKNNYERMKDLNKEVFLCKPINYGVEIIEDSWN